MATTPTRPRRRSSRTPASQRKPRWTPVPKRTSWKQRAQRIRQNNRKIWRASRKLRGGARRRISKRNIFVGLFGLAIATTAFALAATSAISQVAAWELGIAAEGALVGADWLTRKSRDGGPSRAQRAAEKMRAPVCGAPRADGGSCRNRGRCPHHGGAAARSRTQGAGSKPKATGRPGTSRRRKSTP